jgi:hypothetical protein
MTLTERDLRQLAAIGKAPSAVLDELEILRTGIPPARLVRPCVEGDGVLLQRDLDSLPLEKSFSDAAANGRMMKFVPASGAASRMFQLQFSFLGNESLSSRWLSGEIKAGANEARAILDFLQRLPRFAFFPALREAMSAEGLHLEGQLESGDYRSILGFLLEKKGLGYGSTPKGLVSFHLYDTGPRSAFEEHLVEAQGFLADEDGLVRIHFTVASEYLQRVQKHMECSPILEGSSDFTISFSAQRPATDTIAADMSGEPFRTDDGGLLLRPGGHGALLQNLVELNGDIVFVKNIDNVAPDRLKEATFSAKRMLGGYLVLLQEQVFGYLTELEQRKPSAETLSEVERFAKSRLFTDVPEGLNREQLEKFLNTTLNRPLRVCGVVRNEGEPGGGPFWVSGSSGSLSLQIVEASQVDMRDESQRRVWEQSKYFNPVDMACGLRDFKGQPFDLMRYRDPNAGFVSVKSKSGKMLKALELPGLWNGSMACWNTVFFEIPAETFVPVKGVIDLLRPEHIA